MRVQQLNLMQYACVLNMWVVRVCSGHVSICWSVSYVLLLSFLAMLALEKCIDTSFSQPNVCAPLYHTEAITTAI